MQIADLQNVNLMNIEYGSARIMKTIEVPGGMSQRYSYAGNPASIVINGFFKKMNNASAQVNAYQLLEYLDNPDIGFVYIQFQNVEQNLDGFYVLDDITYPRDTWQGGVFFPFRLQCHRIGTIKDITSAIYWTAANETLTTFTGTTAASAIGIPAYSTANDAGSGSSASNVAAEGTSSINVPFRQDPTGDNSPILTYLSSSTIADWFKGTCRVYDTVTTNDLTEANWIQVYSPTHKFTGDIVIQNGVLRYITLNGVPSRWYLWDTITSSWKIMGHLWARNQIMTLAGFNIIRMTPDVIDWRETQSYAGNTFQLTYRLRRSMAHVRVKLYNPSTTALTTSDGPIIYEGGGTWFSSIANAGDSGAWNDHDLTAQTSSTYAVGYEGTRNMAVGFGYTVQPGKQPYKANGSDRIFQSNTWAAGTTHTFFLFGLQLTAGFSLATVRAAANTEAQRTLSSIDSKEILIGSGYMP